MGYRRRRDARRQEGLAIENVAFDVGHIGPGRIEILLELPSDRHAWRDHKGSGGPECKRRERNASGLATTDRQHYSDFSFLAGRIAGKCFQRGISFTLWHADTIVFKNVGFACLKGIFLHLLFSLSAGSARSVVLPLPAPVWPKHVESDIFEHKKPIPNE